MQKVVVGVLAVAAALVCWWFWAEARTETPLQPESLEGSDPQSAPGAAETVPPVGQPAAQTAAQTAQRELPPPQIPPGHTWVVRGRVMQGPDVVHPRAQIRVQCFDGTNLDGAARHEQVVSADGEGSFEWPLPPPLSTVTIAAQGVMPKHTTRQTTELVAIGSPPPQQLEVWVSPLDRIARGTVLDTAMQPIPGAWVGTTRNKRPVAPDGTFEFGLSGSYRSTRVEAGARGFTTARQTIALDDHLEVEAHFVLQPGFRIVGRVVDEQRRPVPGATVATFHTLYEPVETDADGLFEITHGDPRHDNHTLFARKPGYVEGKAQVDGKNPEPSYELVLERGTRVHGRVFAPNGSPVAAAELYIGFSPSAYDRLDAISRDDGTFEFPAVASGEQTMVTSRKGFAPDTRVLEVAESESELEVMVQLQTPHFVAGVVVDGKGNGIEGVSISALQKRSDQPRSRGEYLDVRATTAADGSFRIEGLPGGVVNLEAYGSQILRHLEYDVTVDRADVRLVVKPAARIAGRVVDDATGEPVREFRVHLFQSAVAEGETGIGGYSATWHREGFQFRSDDGVFESKGDHFEVGAIAGIDVSAPGYAPTRCSRIVAATDPDPDDCIVRLVRGGTIRGVVVQDADGSAIAGARIVHFAAERPERHVDSEYGALLRATSGTDGTFVFNDVPPGPASLLVEAAGLPAREAGPITVISGATAECTVRIPVGAGITGVVLDTERKPLPNARVTVVGPEGSYGSAKSDEAGRYAIAATLAPGDHSATVQAQRGDLAYAIHQRVTLIAGRTVEVELAPSGRGVLRGTITGEAAAGLTFQLNAWLLPPGADKPRFSAQIKGASFEIRGLPAGDYRVGVFAMKAGGSAECTLGEGETVEVEVKVTASGR